MRLSSIKTGLPIVSVALAVIVMCGLRRPASGQEKEPAPVQIQMRNVNFRLARDIVLEVRALRGRLERTKPDVPVTFDDPSSFTVDISSAQVAISPASLTALINTHILAYEGAPVKKVVVTIEKGKVIQKGILHKGIDLPFEVEGSLSATEDGNIRLHADKIKGAHLPVKGLLHLFGEDLSKLMNQNEARGMKVIGDDIIMLPQSMTPPPHLKGRVTKVGIVGGKIVQTFDSGRRDPELTPPFRAAGYIYHRGGILRFGKLTMSDADLEIVGDRPGVFDFFQKEYKKQLVAGYSKNTPENGLVSHMVDYSRFVSRPTRGTESGKAPAVTQTQR
jgi:hypothetical protein